MSDVQESGRSEANPDSTANTAVPPPVGSSKDATDDKVDVSSDVGSSGVAGRNKNSQTSGNPSPQPAPVPEPPMEGFRDAPEKQYNFFGSTFHNTSFDGQVRSERSRTWAEELKEVDRSWLADSDGNEETDSIFDAACHAWPRFRIVVLRHLPGGQRHAERLMVRISRWASEREPARKLLSTGNQSALSLKDLAVPDIWPQKYFGSLIYLARRNEPYTARFFSISNSVEVKGLRERLENTDTKLVVSLAAEWDAVEGALDPFDDSVCTLEVAGTEANKTIGVEHSDESAFDAIPRIIAGLFAGLRVSEYQVLVNQFLSTLEVSVSPPREAGDKREEIATPSAPPTRHQRWIKGDIDRVLAELGVRYEMDRTDLARLNNSRTPGYYLSDDASSYANPGWVIASYPALLSSRVDILLAHYFGASASERYQEAFMACLAHLDVLGVHDVSASWVIKGWLIAIDAGADAVLATRKLCWLVEYLQEGDEDSDARFAKSVIDGLAAEAANLELEFQTEVGTEPIRQAMALYAQREFTEAFTEPDDLWSWLFTSSATNSIVRRFSERQMAAQWAILQLSRAWPVEAVKAFATIFDQVTDPASFWRVLARDWKILDDVSRCAAVNTKSLLSLLLVDSPNMWMSFANGVADALGSDVRKAMAKESGTRMSTERRQAAIKGQRLAFTCLYALAPRLYGPDDEQKRRILSHLCLNSDDANHDVSVLGRLLAMSLLPVNSEAMLGPVGEGSLSYADVVRYLRSLARYLLGDKSLSTEQAGDALARITSGLRALIPLESRRALIKQIRTTLDSQFQTRDYLETVENRSALAGVRKSIRASQAVLRNLGGDN